MTEGLDMSLDDIIKNNKKSGRSDAHTSHRGGGGGRGRGHGRSLESGPGPTRRFDNRVMSRTNPYFVPQVVFSFDGRLFICKKCWLEGNRIWKRGQSYTSRTWTMELPTRILSHELHTHVVHLQVLFSDVGELKRYSIHYDRSGRSKGTAEVVYMRQPDAVAAMKRYNNVLLDGKPMKLELVGINIFTPVPIPPMQKGILGNPINASSRSCVLIKFCDLGDSIQGRIVGRGQERVGNGNRGSWSGKSRGQQLHKPSAEDLDADLEKYRLQAMHIN
ncbi:Nucleotide-binding, alpha-beta plait [Cynara cardunculus var. scolymus]|uniref:Nucleotide-binding, alpha-beta plait n=1 Tax=Cynara cardunculus var. scolymus TaxID=59895 RepID=A0A103YIN2_CYNCS|nr:Nucleotide-binding, alpha-beta plait [Cynara cardunculus var. scolymus]